MSKLRGHRPGGYVLFYGLAVMALAACLRPNSYSPKPPKHQPPPQAKTKKGHTRHQRRK